MKQLHAFTVCATILAVVVCRYRGASRIGRAQVVSTTRSLEGNWAGKNSQGQPIEVSFRMTAGGSALMSEIHGHGAENMITMFHMDGDRLLMTHYCSMGNQPRMKVVGNRRQIRQL